MSFKTLNIGTTALMTSQLALNTVGHNVSNAATPGYTRQRVFTEAALPEIKTFGVLGSGVQVRAVKRVADEFLEMQVREATTLHNYFSANIDSYENLQAVFNELSENDLSTTFDQFWNGLSDVNNYVEDISTRRGLINEGLVLAENFNHLDDKLRDMRERMNSNVQDAVAEVNALIEEVARLNQDVVRAEKGGEGKEVANDSRDQRGERLRELSELLDITVVEEPNGQVVVSLRGRLLVFENQFFGITTEQVNSDDMLIDNVIFESDGEEIQPGQGKMGAFIEIRDEILHGYKEDLDRLAGTFLWEFNRQHSQGQGLEGYQSISSDVSVIDPLVRLDELEYEFEPLDETYDIQNGNVELKVRNEITGEVETLNLEIDLDDTSEPDTVLYHDNNEDVYDSLDNINLFGLDFGVNTDDRGELYWRVTDANPAPGPQGPYTVEAFREDSMAAAERVAVGTLPIGPGQGTVTLAQDNGSGISGTVDLTYTQDDATIVTADLFNNSFVSKVQNALDGYLPDTFEVSVDVANRVTIESTSSDYTLGFGRDTSGVLAALGLNTFFRGYDARTISVDQRIQDHPEHVAAATQFRAGDNTNAVEMLKLREALIYENGTASVDDYYQGIVGRMGVEFAQTNSLLETQEDILKRVKNQREDLSGVNLDEELSLMIQYQRSFQSAARFISTADQIYESLITM
jgi:flagellar hook-associated protein 1 FlgK